MLNTLDYSQVPSDFIHCFKKDCRLADHCLRYQVTPFIPRERWSVSVINPSIAGTGDDCRAYLSDTPLIYAYGMDHLFDNLPYAKAREARYAMREHYGKNHFYRLKRKERCFDPKEQQYVSDLFRRFHIESEPVFDTYREGFRWVR